MNPKNRFWLFAVISIAITNGILISSTVLIYRDLSPDERLFIYNFIAKYGAYLFTAIILIIAAQVLVLDAIFHTYIIPLSKLVDETTLIGSVNPSHRIKLDGGDDIRRLVKAINETAERYEELSKNVQQKINRAKADVENEKNIMAMFMSELPQGVLICNAEGRIIFYNRKGRALLCEELAATETEIPDNRFVGLGRSIFDFIDSNLIHHSLGKIDEKLKQKETNIAATFVMVRAQKRIMVETVPILNPLRQFTGFLLVLFDMSLELEAESRVDFLLQDLLRNIRGSCAGVRSAIEAVLEYPDMKATQLACFKEIIHKETISLSDTVNRIAAEYYQHVKTQWPLAPISDVDLMQMITRRAKDRINVDIQIIRETNPHWVKVDTYSLVLAIIFLLNQLRHEIDCRTFVGIIQKSEHFVNFDFSWQGQPLKIDMLRKWKNQPIIVENEGFPLNIREVAGHHAAEIWSFMDKDTGLPCLRLSLPITEAYKPEAQREIAILPYGRMEFYDFDLFNQPGQIPELDDSLLSSLSYTVFDTETTGLNPHLDEIISIGAIRIVNGNLLRQEIFDQLIDPKRDIPIESIRFHGIHPDMLAGKPHIEQVLPLFHQFCADTILVAHNAAFDMKMLEMKTQKTGVKFINPVLDTLLLDAVAHSVHERHDIESLAERLGIKVINRHSALGDAIATGEMLLKLIPLLAKKGIYTLKEARLASQKTFYARLKY